MNFVSIWIVRLPIAAILAGSIGLRGVWLAMAIELTFRGVIFLVRLLRGRWLRNGLKHAPTDDLPNDPPSVTYTPD